MIVAFDLPNNLFRVVEAYATQKKLPLFLAQLQDLEAIETLIPSGDIDVLILFYHPICLKLFKLLEEYKDIPLIICSDVPVPMHIGERAQAIIFLNQEVEALKKALESLKL